MNSSTKILAHLFPSVGNIIFLVIFLHLLFGGGQLLLSDGDTGYHIRAGEYILDNLSIPRQDIFSYHSPPIPWIAHEWLSELIMAWIHNHFGLNGIVFFYSLVIACIFYILFKFLRTNDSNIIIAIFLIIIAAPTSSLHWLARPHVISLLLLLIWYFLLDEYQYRERNLLVFLPFLMVLWVNLHGGFIIGFLLLGIYFLGNIIEAVFSIAEEKKLRNSKAKRIIFITFLCFASALINPYGHRIFVFPFSIISEKYFMDFVAEFLSPNFHTPVIMFFEALLLFTVIIQGLSKKRLDVIELFLVVSFVHMALYSCRYIALFSIIISPILIRQIEALLKKSKSRIFVSFKNKTAIYSDFDYLSKGYLWPSIGILIAILGVFGGFINSNFDEKKKPVAAVEFLKKEHIDGNMFNNDEIGDYIIYKAFPLYRVFIDGRLDMYGPEKLKEYQKVIEFRSGWEDIIKKYKIQWIIFYNDSYFSRFLLGRDDWKLIYSDKMANIFVKDISKYEYLIKKYKEVKPLIRDESDYK